MAEELAYALLTPHSLVTKRTGGILARLLNQAGLEFVAARLYRLSDELVDRYSAVLKPMPRGIEPKVAEAHLNYLAGLKGAAATLNTALLVLLKGENAAQRVAEEVGTFVPHVSGMTIRDGFGDRKRNGDGSFVYYEPAVLTALDAATNTAHLKLFAEYARTCGGVHEEPVKKIFPPGVAVETTLLMLKPENFRKPSRRPGDLIDLFARTGLMLTAANLFGMTPAQGEEFYGPLREMFRDRFRGRVAGNIKEALTPKFGFAPSDAAADQMAGVMAAPFADFEFNRIAEYMTGVNPAAVTGEARNQPGTTKCLALLWTGQDAVAKVRKVLGATDPAKAEPGTVRSDFGRNIMENGAHASDSAENTVRERKIIGLTGNEPGPTPVEKLVAQYVK